MLRGIVLQYSGEKAGEFTQGPATLTDQLQQGFKNIGAIAIRIQQTQSQRATLLQSITEANYATNPTSKPSEGNNEPDVFSFQTEDSATHRATKKLEMMAHYTLGIGKVLNERTQPQKNKNLLDLGGEEHLWDAIHTPIWSLGLGLPYQLSSQGFLYVCHPNNISAADYQTIASDLEKGLFTKVALMNDKIIIKTHSGFTLNTDTFSAIDISMDPAHQITKQENGFVVTSEGLPAPIGWALHCGEKDQLVDPLYTEDLLRIIRTAKGGSHKFTQEEYHLLFERHRAKTDDVQFTQNRTLNLLDDVMRALEKQFQFNPLALIGNSIKTAYKLIQKKTQETDVTEDLLTGHLITEMVQPLMASQPYSERPAPRFTHSFNVSQNTLKAFAYSFDIKKPDGSLILKTDENPITPPDGDLIDVHVHGELQAPDLTNPKHVAALLSTGILVAEQMILEQLIRDAAEYGDEHPNALALRKILSNDDLYEQIITMANTISQRNKFGFILGVQIPECEEILKLLRNELGFNDLITIADELYQGDKPASVSEAAKDKALLKLYNIGKTLQNLKSTSAMKQGSRGINAGIIPVIGRIAPNLHHQLMLDDGLPPIHEAPKPSMKKIDASDTENLLLTEAPHPLTARSQDSIYGVGTCPFFSRQPRRPAVPTVEAISSSVTSRSTGTSPVTSTPKVISTVAPKNDRGWCGFFAKCAPVIAAGLALGTYAVVSCLK